MRLSSRVEATKFTEVGYVGRDVESIVRDLADMSIKMLREQEMDKVQVRAAEAAEERILDALLPPPRRGPGFSQEEPVADESSTRQIFRKKLREGELDDKDINIEVSDAPVGVEIMAPPGMEEMSSQLQKHVFQHGRAKEKRAQAQSQRRPENGRGRRSRPPSQRRRLKSQSYRSC